MELKSVDIVMEFQFEIIGDDGQVTWYRRSTGEEPNWSQLLGESWESLYDYYEELEEIYIKWQKQQTK